MSIPWSIINAILFLASIAVLALVYFVPAKLVNWLNNSESTVHAVTKIPMPKRESFEITPDAADAQRKLEEQVAAALTVKLQRMQPPKPAPPPEAPKPAPPPKEVETQLYQGTLMGVIVDSDPRHSYAVLKGSDNRVLLVVSGQSVDGTGKGATLDEISPNSVVIRKGDRKQTLLLQGVNR